MTRLAVRAGSIVGGVGGVHRQASSTVLVEEGLITAVVDGHPPVDCATIGDGTEMVCPGLIDIHTHGAVGVQTIDGDVDGLRRLSAFYAAHGVTGFLATIGGSDASIGAGLDGVRALLADATTVDGAACLGVHLEGPFISLCCAGAFDPASIVSPDLDTFLRYGDRAAGALKMVTLAPEVEGAADVISAAQRLGVVCSAGHSAATEAEASAAVEMGVSAVTHLFNAMPQLHHRQPGLVGVALGDPRLTAELICDGVHVHPRVVDLANRVKSPAAIALITDSIAAAGLPDGEYEFEEQHVFVRDQQARLADGTLAGSTLTLDEAVRNFAAFADIAWARAIEAATSTPARLLGLATRKGAIVQGFDADLAGFDATGQPVWTVVAGRVVFCREDAS